MTCKDCIYYEMCLPRVAVGGNKICQYFKDKSLYINCLVNSDKLSMMSFYVMMMFIEFLK